MVAAMSTNQTTSVHQTILLGKLVSPVVEQANEGAKPTNTENDTVFPQEKVNVKLSDKNFLKLCIYEKDAFALVDSGSDLTIIGNSFFEKHPDLIQNVIPCERKAQTANAESLDIVGTLTFHVEISKVKYAVLAHVSPKTPWEIILGVDFLRQYGVQIDFQNSVLKIPNNSNLFNTHKVILPPFSSKIVKCSLSSRARATMTAIITGKPSIVKRGLSCVEAYVNVQAGHKFIFIEITNDDCKYQVLHKVQKLPHLKLLTVPKHVTTLMQMNANAKIDLTMLLV